MKRATRGKMKVAENEREKMFLLEMSFPYVSLM
jgi:hypothetical protein